MAKSNFIAHPLHRGEGRCRVCDLAYSINSEREVRAHAAYHKRYLRACDAVGAPAPEDVRKKLRSDGQEMRQSASLDVRVEGAEKEVLAAYHDYLAEVLIYDIKNRLDLREFFTQRIENRGLLRNFDPDVAYEMRFRYSDHPMYD